MSAQGTNKPMSILKYSNVFQKSIINGPIFSYLSYKMKFLQLLLCLILLHSSVSVQILQSSTSTTIISPPSATTVYSSYYNSLLSGIAGPGVQWITIYRGPTVYRELFYTSCTGSANLTITAATSFNAYLDGVLVAFGANYTIAYNVPIKLSCGNHNLTIVVYQSAGLAQGLTFGINQDQSGCYNCEATGYWNEYTCSCSCIADPCPCGTSRVWKGYPICGCGCRPRIVLDTVTASTTTTPKVPAKSTTTAAAKASDLISFPYFCLAPRYYSQQTCSCVCHFTYCPDGQYFDQVNCKCYHLIT